MKKLTVVLAGLACVLAFLPGCGMEEPAPGAAGDVSGGADESLPEEAPPPEEEEPEEEPLEEEPIRQWEWEFDLPENHGMDGALLEELHALLEDTKTLSMLTVKDGVVVDEYYKDEYDETSVFRVNSCTKSFTSALIGIAIDQGLISGIDAPLSEFFLTLDEDKESITIRHLLEHTSGIEWYEWNSGSTFQEWRRSDNWVRYILDQPMADEPGAVFNYSTGGPHLLAAILEMVVEETAWEFAREHIFDPLGMDSVEWLEDSQGVLDGGNGLLMTARDAAKFGQLFLNGGRWDGRQLVPQAWVEASTTRQSSGIGSSGVYGYQWWIRTFGAQEYDTYYAMGHAGQFIFVVPELDLVTVVTSEMSQDTYEPRTYFSDYILAACE